jgi:RND family efflux transporter MFP subunit
MRSFLLQIPLIAAALVAALVLWVNFVPASRPFLERHGILARMEQLGLPVPAAEVPAAGAPGAPARGGFGRGPATVTASPPGTGTLNDTVTAVGTGQALRSVTLSPEVSGRIVSIAVGAGGRVEAGAVILTLDDSAEAIALDRARLVVADAEARLERVRRLQSSGTATDLQIREAELALRQAELNEREAAFERTRRVVRAPISGWVGLMTVETGAQVTPSTQIARIDDRSAIVVDFRVPERFVGQIAPGDSVAARPLGLPGIALEGRVSALDNRVDETSRTLRLQALIENTDDRLRAGMAFEISAALEGERYPAVDPLSVQWGSEGAFVWVVREGRAARLPVRIMQRSADSVLVQASFQPGDVVVVEGVQSVRPGAEVAVEPADTGSEGNAAQAQRLPGAQRG